MGSAANGGAETYGGKDLSTLTGSLYVTPAVNARVRQWLGWHLWCVTDYHLWPEPYFETASSVANSA
jgi:hypothetical protein